MGDETLYHVQVNKGMTVGFEGVSRIVGDTFVMSGLEINQMQGTRKGNLFVTVIGPVEEDDEE